MAQEFWPWYLQFLGHRVLRESYPALQESCSVQQHTGSMIFTFFLLVSKTSHWEMRWDSKPVSKTHLAHRFFPSCIILTAVFYSPLKLKLMPPVSNSNHEFHWEISSHFTKNILFKWLLKDRLSYLVAWCCQPIKLDQGIETVIDMFWRLTNQDFNIRLVDVKMRNTVFLWQEFPSLPPKAPLAFLSRLNNSLSLPFQMPFMQASHSTELKFWFICREFNGQLYKGLPSSPGRKTHCRLWVSLLMQARLINLKELTNFLSLTSCQIRDYVLLYLHWYFQQTVFSNKQTVYIHSELHAVIPNKWPFTGVHCLIANYTLKRRNENDVSKAFFLLRSDKPLHNHWYCNRITM